MKKEAVENGDMGGSTDTQPVHCSMLGGFTYIRAASVRACGLAARNAALERTKCSDGSVLGGFTSIRAASVRASGLAARNAALERTKSFDGSMLGGFTCIRAASVRASGLAACNAALERTKNFGGSMLGGFTSIRAASVRASGLAARNAALEGTKSNSCSTMSDNIRQVQTSGKDGASVNKGSLKLDSDLKKRHEEQAQQQQKVQTQPTPNPNRPTFWTVCPFCAVKDDYYKELVNKPLICKSCNKRFTGFEDNGPTNYSGTSSKASQRMESVMNEGQPSTDPQSTFKKCSPKPTKVGTKVFENVKLESSGLAARNAALERTKSNSCSTTSDNVPQVQTSGKDGAFLKGSLKLEKDLKKHHEDYNRQATQRNNRQPSARAHPWFQNVNLGNAAPTPMNQLAQAQQQQKVQTQLTPNPNRPTFWTVCPFCGVKYEYYKELVNKPLICKCCNMRFTGFEDNGPTNYSGTSSKASQKMESVMKKGQPSTVPQTIFKKCSPKPTKVGTKVFENVKLETSLETLFTSQANKKPKRLDNIRNTGHQSEQNLRLSSRFRQQVSYDDYMSDDEFGKPSKKAKFAEEDDVDLDDDEIIDHDGVGPTTPLGGGCVVHDLDFNDFDSERTMEKFKVGQIWALYSDEDTLPKDYGIITKINTLPNFGLRMSWLTRMKSEDIIPWVDEDMPVTCGKFKVSRNTSQKYDDPGPFSHEVKAQRSKEKGVYDILPQKGDVWALYKGWNKNMSNEDLQICEYEIVEVIKTDYKSSITVLILEHVKGYKSVFKPQKGGESEELTMQIPWSEMLKFSHQILAVRLSEEKEGTLRGFWELDTAALPVYHFL